MRPNPDSQVHQQVAAADTKADPAVVALAAAMVVVWEAVAAGAKFTSLTSVTSLPYWFVRVRRTAMLT